MKEQSYKDPRPPESMDRFHEYARTHDPGWTYPVVRVIFTPIAVLLYRTRTTGRENVPKTGGFILAPNHFSNMDHFFCGFHLKQELRFMAKSQLWNHNAPLTYLFKNAGHFPVRRGHGDEEAFITASSIIDRGGVVGMYAEGGRSRTGELGEAKPGIGRLALETGAPVVPTAIHGSSGVKGWRGGRFPKITVTYGKPMQFEADDAPSRERQQAIAEEIFAEVKELYAGLAAKSAGS